MLPWTSRYLNSGSFSLEVSRRYRKYMRSCHTSCTAKFRISHINCLHDCPYNITLRWRHNGSDSVSNHQPHDCLLNRLCRRRSKKTSKLFVTDLCAVNSPGTGEFTAQIASNAENVSIWWRHHDDKVRTVYIITCICYTLTYWGRGKIAAISQTTLSNAFSWLKIMNFAKDFTEVCS